MFKSKDKEYMSLFKEAIYSSPYLNEDEAKKLHTMFKNNIITNDLHTHISLLPEYKNYDIVYMGHGSFTPTLLFITNLPSELNQDILNLLNSISSALNIPNYYCTSFSKFSTYNLEHHTSMLEFINYQIKYLNPSIIISFDTPIDNSLLNPEITFIKTLSIDNLPSDNESLKTLKNKIWKDIKHILSL